MHREELSEYELLRLRNVEENRRLMRFVGFYIVKSFLITVY